MTGQTTSWTSMLTDREARRRLLEGVLPKRVVPPVPPGRTPAADGPEAETPDPWPGKIAGLGLYIEYEDAGGRRSERRITCRALAKRPAGQTLIAWCHERNAPREFRIDRIAEVVDLVTGELLDPAEVFGRYIANASHFDRPDLDRIVRVLVFLARCDGRDHPSEWIAVEDAIAAYCLRYDGDDELCSTTLHMARRLAPTGLDFVAALRWFIRQPDGPKLARLVLDHSRKLIDADGVLRPEEIRWGVEVENVLQRTAMRR
ncbi:WYL domain-containing protein [Bradyrhizobium sp.]|uniref:tellurite resistance TerB family protein n=1 Tax=Bradyrhizobium sp. TaxID=376 RepID=UPI0025C1447D|nr:WYL domain-containing protein [Bradyrhizobium sp.]MCA3256288.1 hypothetical protein [Alphaproteobacteria bacterium]MCA3565983.1 hypothetical protein [Bradyrhizobium sp.]